MQVLATAGKTDHELVWLSCFSGIARLRSGLVCVGLAVAALLISRAHRPTMYDMWYDAVSNSIFSRTFPRGHPMESTRLCSSVRVVYL